MSTFKAMYLGVGTLIVVSLSQTSTRAQAILASGNPNGTSHVDIVPYNQSLNRFAIDGSVSHNTGFGPWEKRLVGPAPNTFSGDRLDIVEIINNVGTDVWTDWHEKVLSTTTINTPDDPGFLFDRNTINVYRNNVLLAEGLDYALQGDPFFGGGNGGHYRAIDIFFSSGSTILPGDQLRIEKQIFEVFGDGNVWQQGEQAIIAQYPTIPEPSAIVLAGLGALACLSGRRRAR